MKEEGRVKDHQATLIEILRSVLAAVKKQFALVSSEPFPLIPADLVEMSAYEFESAIRALPANFSSDHIFDLTQLRQILGSFGHFSRSIVLANCRWFVSKTKSLFYNYKGF